MSGVRPVFNPEGLPASVRERAIQKAAQSWCYVTPDGRSFFVTEAQANGMRDKQGGTVYPPAVTE